MQKLSFALGLICAALVLTGCNRTPPPVEAGARTFEVRGVVRGFAPDRSTVDVEHEDIPGLMPSMTMPFTVKEPKEAAQLKIGDAIQFRMIVTDKDLFLDQVKKIAATEVRLKAPSAIPTAASRQADRLKEGELVPSFSLTNQNDSRIASDSFRGHPLVLTFVFTRCPVPNFCPLLSHKFSELQSAIKADATLAGTRLLSVTLDPAFDTPAILKTYAEYQQADPAIWTFATGEPAQINILTQSFGVFVQSEAGTINHGLATALIAPDGTVAKIWRGNGWKVAEVLEELRRPAK
jgi:protein SCO1